MGHFGLFSGFEHDSHGEFRSDILFTGHLDFAVHHFRDAFCDRHAQPAPAVPVGRGGVLLGKDFEELRQVVAVHSDPCIFDPEAQNASAGPGPGLFGREADRSGRIGEFYGIAEDVDQDPFQLGRVTGQGILRLSDDFRFIVQPFFITLASDHGIDLLQYVTQRKIFFLQDHAPGFDPVHVQYVIDEVQQMLRRRTDFFEVAAYPVGQPRFLQGDVAEPEDHVHRCAHFMTHAGEETCLRAAALFGSHQFGTQLFVLPDAAGDVPEQSVVHENINASAEKDPGDDQIRMPEEPDGKVTGKKKDQENCRNDQCARVPVRAFLFADLRGKTCVAVYVEDHQRTSEINHCVRYNIHHNRSLFPLSVRRPKPVLCILFVGIFF